MSKLHDLYDDQGQSPWLDNMRRGWITGGDLARWVERGVRGITSNPTIFQKAISAGHDYDEQFGELIAGGASIDTSNPRRTDGIDLSCRFTRRRPTRVMMSRPRNASAANA